MDQKRMTGVLKNLSPKEVQVIKGQIAALLNYTTHGGGAARIPEEIREKIDDKDAEGLVSEIARLLRPTK